MNDRARPEAEGHKGTSGLTSMPSEGESELDRAARHVREGEEVVQCQQDLIAEMKEAEQDTTSSEDILKHIENNLTLHRRHLRRVKR